MPDGGLDSSFHSGQSSQSLTSVLLQPDGKILICAHQLVRLLPNGLPDTSFKTGPGFYAGSIHTLALLPDNKIMAGGSFQKYQNHTVNHLVRIHPDGRFDSSFHSTANNYVWAIQPLPAGKILVGGYSGRYLEQLLPDGSIDPGFNSGDAFGEKNGPGFADDVVLSLSRQADGQLLVGGGFLFFDKDLTHPKLMRLNGNGTADLSFRVGTSLFGHVQSLVTQQDGKILLASADGYFGVRRRGPVRLMSDGSLDTSFAPRVNSRVESILEQPDKKILLGGWFQVVNGQLKSSIARLNADGTSDTSFHIGAGFAKAISALNSPIVNRLVLCRDGGIVAAGTFGFYDRAPVQNICRLLRDGTLDATFHAPPIHEERLSEMIGLPDGKILLSLQRYPWTAANARLLRLHPDGSIDTVFSPLDAEDWFMQRLFVQPDGKMIVVMSHTRNYSLRAIRLLPDGTHDNGFAPWKQDIFAMQPDGKLLFRDSTGNGRMARDGALDNSFAVSAPYSFAITCTGFAQDGTIVIGGNATDEHNKQVKNGVYRLENCIVDLQPRVLMRVKQSTPYRDSLFVTQPKAGLPLSLVSGAVPSGLELSLATGALSGTATSPGLFSFSVAADNGRCRDTFHYTITIDTLSAHDSVNADLIVYPIPVSDVLHIHFGNVSPGDYEVVLFDAAGKRLLEEIVTVKYPGEKAAYNVAHLPAGMYLLRIWSGDRWYIFKVNKH